jgi:hypothetical protein
MLIERGKEETMQRDVFYLHEDEWAMIDLLPSENFEELLRTARAAQTFGEEHFDGFGWTDMYQIPPPTSPLSLRTLPFNELQGMLKERFLQARSVQSGYSSYNETLPDSFAFVEAEKADGAFYGKQENGLVIRLHLLPCNSDDHSHIASFADILHTLGMRYDLVLVDWWKNTIIDLREKHLVVEYLAAQQ